MAHPEPAKSKPDAPGKRHETICALIDAGDYRGAMLRLLDLLEPLQGASK